MALRALAAVLEFRGTPQHIPLRDAERDIGVYLITVNRETAKHGASAFGIAFTRTYAAYERFVRSFVYVVDKRDMRIIEHAIQE